MRRALTILATAALLLGASQAGRSAGDADPPPATWATWVVNAPPSDVAAGAERPAGEAVARWTKLALALVAQRAMKNPPAIARSYAYLSVAMCDAAVLAARRRDDAALADAAVAGAAATVLADQFPERPARFYAAEAEAATAGMGPAGAEGLALGREAGAAAVRRAHRDGFGRPWFGRPPRGGSRWASPPGKRVRPLEPLAGSWRPWLLRTGRELRPGPPPRYGSRAFEREARELVRLDANATRAQRLAARRWAAGPPPSLWNGMLLDRLAADGWSTPRAARALALLNVALADAGVAAWDAKYAYWSPRPENAIRDLRISRRFDPDLDTPPFPSYVSGHAVFSGAAAEVLSDLFPGDAAAWRAQAEEAAASRLWGGIHFRSDSTVGLAMGREIGRRAVARGKVLAGG